MFERSCKKCKKLLKMKPNSTLLVLKNITKQKQRNPFISVYSNCRCLYKIKVPTDIITIIMRGESDISGVSPDTNGKCLQYFL